MFGCVLSMFAICSFGFMPVRVSHTHIDITKPYKHKATTFQSQQAAGFFVDAASSNDCLFSLIFMEFCASEFWGYWPQTLRKR